MGRRRARELGLGRSWGPCGPHKAITDVPGVRVGHTTLIRGDGPTVVGRGPVRTGVTVVLPRPEPIWRHPVFAGCHRATEEAVLNALLAADTMTGRDGVTAHALPTD